MTTKTKKGLLIASDLLIDIIAVLLIMVVNKNYRFGVLFDIGVLMLDIVFSYSITKAYKKLELSEYGGEE